MANSDVAKSFTLSSDDATRMAKDAKAMGVTESTYTRLAVKAMLNGREQQVTNAANNRTVVDFLSGVPTPGSGLKGGGQ